MYDATGRKQHVPDILDCLAQLSNDEVPTPPRLARAMLDLLPAEVWSNPDYRWLDPCCKSGAILREVAARLLAGLEAWQPDFGKRREHIFRNMLFGTSVTELTGQVVRRSVYCSRDASGDRSVVRFELPAGNIPFVPAKHDFGPDGNESKCRICGAPADLERGEKRENYAYAFIHGAYPTQELSKMKFDVIVGNPPYQINDGGHNASATPVYHRFVETAISLKPRYVLMITPSRWFAGGKGLGGFRERMLTSGQVRRLVDYPKLYDAFPSVKIRGGVSYFLWDRNHQGTAAVSTRWNGEQVGPEVARPLDEFDVFVRRNEAVPILKKIRAKNEAVLSERVSSAKPFGFRTFFHGRKSARNLKDPIKLYGSQRVSWIKRTDIVVNPDWVDDWKVLMTAVQGTSAAVETRFLSPPLIAAPGEACTETYLVAGRFSDKLSAERFALYLRTRFVRFLVSLRKATQHATRDVYKFVPDLPMDRTWTDKLLYKRYKLTPDEVAFIESQVKELPADGKDNA
ncbi:Eco57I restriction-modification methylase domain-containing protein [Luteimonas sp. MJ250]|uniref:Eco57I restriction-modification methylase domain-containing protein n=1 Tax=Luteimonas sp. MJ250 TaxID=3129236 RepID=UPI0031BADD72